jgi:hypothetical protein
MTPIKLTTEQENKLLEMCKALFPKHFEYYMSDERGTCKSYNYPWSRDYVLFTDRMGFTTMIMHWFEFCMTQLVEKILNPNPEKPLRGLQRKFKDFFWETNIYWEKNQASLENNDDSQNDKKHPIDYLYDEFKKLKI